MSIGCDVGDTMARANSQPLQYRRPAIAPSEKLRVAPALLSAGERVRGRVTTDPQAALATVYSAHELRQVADCVVADCHVVRNGENSAPCSREMRSAARYSSATDGWCGLAPKTISNLSA